jgi:hypothetical protein
VQAGKKETRTILRSNFHHGTQVLEIQVAVQHRNEAPLWVKFMTALFFTCLSVGCVFFLQIANTGEEKLIAIVGIGSVRLFRRAELAAALATAQPQYQMAYYRDGYSQKR